MRSYELSEREVLAWDCSEEEEERVYADFAEGLRVDIPRRRDVRGMREEELGHRRRWIERYRRMCGEHIPADPAGRCADLGASGALVIRPLRIDGAQGASPMEGETRRFTRSCGAHA